MDFQELFKQKLTNKQPMLARDLYDTYFRKHVDRKEKILKLRRLNLLKPKKENWFELSRNCMPNGTFIYKFQKYKKLYSYRYNDYYYKKI